jgi:hypothetical protein
MKSVTPPYQETARGQSRKQPEVSHITLLGNSQGSVTPPYLESARGQLPPLYVETARDQSIRPKNQSPLLLRKTA